MAIRGEIRGPANETLLDFGNWLRTTPLVNLLLGGVGEAMEKRGQGMSLGPGDIASAALDAPIPGAKQIAAIAAPVAAVLGQAALIRKLTRGAKVPTNIPRGQRGVIIPADKPKVIGTPEEMLREHGLYYDPVNQTWARQTSPVRLVDTPENIINVERELEDIDYPILQWKEWINEPELLHNPDTWAIGVHKDVMPYNVSGVYDSNNNFAKNYFNYDFPPTQRRLEESINHELQHSIQNINRWFRGGNTKQRHLAEDALRKLGENPMHTNPKEVYMRLHGEGQAVTEGYRAHPELDKLPPSGLQAYKAFETGRAPLGRIGEGKIVGFPEVFWNPYWQWAAEETDKVLSNVPEYWKEYALRHYDTWNR